MTDAPAYTPAQRVLRYYPQRVQTLLMAALNLGLIVASEVGVDLSVVLTAALNAFVLALLVFFYGEPRTSSKAAVADWLDAAEEHSQGGV